MKVTKNSVCKRVGNKSLCAGKESCRRTRKSRQSSHVPALWTVDRGRCHRGHLARLCASDPLRCEGEQRCPSLALSSLGRSPSCCSAGNQAPDPIIKLSLPNPSCVKMNSHKPLFTSSQNHSLQHKRSRQLADYAKEAAGLTQEQLFQLLLQVAPHRTTQALHLLSHYPGGAT